MWISGSGDHGLRRRHPTRSGLDLELYAGHGSLEVHPTGGMAGALPARGAAHREVLSSLTATCPMDIPWPVRKYIYIYGICIIDEFIVQHERPEKRRVHLISSW